MAKRGNLLMLVMYLLVAVFTVEAISSAGPTALKRFNGSAARAKGNDTSELPLLSKLKLNQKSDGFFKDVDWRSITYKKTLYNPAIPAKDRSDKVSDSLLLRCELELAKPELLLGWSIDPIIDQLSDSRGRELHIGQEKTSSRPTYFPSEIAMPKGLAAEEESEIPGGSGTPSKKPENIDIRLELGELLREPIVGEIGRVKGRCNVVVAESIDYIEVPFRPSDEWVRISPDTEIKVLEAQNVTGMYHFVLDVRGEYHGAMIITGGEDLPDPFF